MVLDQYASDVKSCEITAIPKLLVLLSLRGSTVTINAMGCPRDIAKAMVDNDANYIFLLNSNPKSLHTEFFFVASVPARCVDK